MKAAEHLAKEAWCRWIREEDGIVVDDITAVVVYLNPSANANLCDLVAIAPFEG